MRSAADGASPIRNGEGRWVIAHRPSSCVNWPQPYPGAVEPASNQLPTRTGTGLSPVGPQAQRASSPDRRLRSGVRELTQHVLQDAAVAVVVGLTGCVDADHTVEVDAGAIVLRRRDLDSGRGRALVELRDAFDGEGLGAVEPERLSRLAGGELQRQDAHADEVRAVDALEALSDDGLDAEQLRALGGPVTRGSRAVLLATEDDQRDAGGL